MALFGVLIVARCGPRGGADDSFDAGHGEARAMASILSETSEGESPEASRSHVKRGKSPSPHHNGAPDGVEARKIRG